MVIRQVSGNTVDSAVCWRKAYRISLTCRTEVIKTNKGNVQGTKMRQELRTRCPVAMPPWVGKV